MIARGRPLALAASVALALALPFALTGFALFQLTLAMSYAIAIAGLVILTGHNGQFSLGHSAFFALGAYATAILTERAGFPFFLALPVTGVACFTAGWAFGWPAARLQGIYLALATFALAVATPQLLKSSPFEGWTGGVQGMIVGRPPLPSLLPLSADQWLYTMTLALMVLMFACAMGLLRSRFGRAITAISDDEVAAHACGIDVARHRALTFAISALYAGVAGALAAATIGFVAPDSFTFAFSIALFVGLVIGGARSILGATIGGLFILFVPNIAEGVSKGLAGAVYGVLLIGAVYLMPSGAAGLAQTIAKKLGR
jgi:branched-chain amino acid transport system permease protein